MQVQQPEASSIRPSFPPNLRIPAFSCNNWPRTKIWELVPVILVLLWPAQPERTEFDALVGKTVLLRTSEPCVIWRSRPENNDEASKESRRTRMSAHTSTPRLPQESTHPHLNLLQAWQNLV
ncbi:hypothetical protein SCLCIDRAFT_979487 [Scleroderma citrinum Foug A]|uniref:Uncharacterized protein n=1 Tax=Scleroderma citrinum Foug A TaxID=1036808 RepID=A0A0C3DUS5_9AGAM|nr:hypothetical protein SCLCIDRAFT_979487 [Scleroderma citrinum Foug A]